MEATQLLAAFEADMRRGPGAAPPNARLETDGAVVRVVAGDRDGWSGVTWSQLDEASADAVIARQAQFFAALGRSFEWKLYDCDQPPDLGARLAAAGLDPDPSEAVLVAEAAAVPPAPLPGGLTLRTVATPADVARLAALHHQVFGGDQERVRRARLAELRAGTGRTVMLLVLAGGEPVSAARIDFPPGGQFAGLYSGGTLPGWRRRGVYRALVGHRARLAAERGYRYLAVDATADSEPILRRLEFRRIARTTPYHWPWPAGARGRASA